MSPSRTNLLLAAAAERLGVRCEPLGQEPSDWLRRLVGPTGSVVVSKTRSPFLTQVAQTLANHKRIARELIATRDVAVVPSLLVDESVPVDGDAVRAFLATWGRVAVKPNSGNRARGVAAGLTDAALVAGALERARDLDADEEALLEPHVDGTNLRIAVIGGRFAAAAEIRRPSLHGGDPRPVAQWVAELNADPRRGTWRQPTLSPLDQIELEDDDVLVALAAHGLDPDARVPAGASFELLGEEAETIDVTDEVHPTWADAAVRACLELGVDVGGVDFRGTRAQFSAAAPSSWTPGGPALLEVNVSPALHLHALPSVGAVRPVFEDFVAYCLQLPGAPPPCAEVHAGRS
jgi:cyanophycin synthetase